MQIVLAPYKSPLRKRTGICSKKKGDLEIVKQYGLKLTDWHSSILYSERASITHC